MSNSIPVNPQLFHSGGISMQYATWGTGKTPLLAFHGFSRSRRDYASFTKNLQEEFTIYAFDLFFHETSSIGDRKPDKEPLQPEELKTFFENFLKHIHAGKAWLMGYSLGGRIALKLAEIMPDKIGGLYLFAPDGLIVNRWYAILSFSAPGRALFRFFIKHNSFFLGMLHFIFRVGLIGEKRKIFVLAHIKSPKMQWQIYNVWTFLRKIDPKIKNLESVLAEKRITVDLFMGKYDRVIPIKSVKRLKKSFPDLKVHLLESGHIMLTPQVAGTIKEKRLLQLPGNS